MQGKSGAMASLRIKTAGMAVLLAAAFVALAGAKSAGAAEGWSVPRKIFDAPGLIGTQSIVADPYGQVHGFWAAQDYGGAGQLPSTLYYQRLDKLDSHPVMDLMQSASAISGVRAAMDGQGRLFVSSAGNDVLRSDALNASSLRSWKSAPGDKRALFYGDVAVDKQGAAWIAYGGLDTSAVYVQKWREGSQNWGEPVMVAQNYYPNSAPDYIRMAFTGHNTVHVVWSEYPLPSAWPPQGTLYSRSTDGGLSWSKPVEIVSGVYHQATLAVGPHGELHMAWNGAVGTGGRYHKVSLDEGVTWSNTDMIIPAGKGGSENNPNMLVDSQGVVHVLTSYDNAAWHTALRNGVWSEPECVSCGAGVPRGHLEGPSMALSGGNRLHVMFWADDTQLFHTSRAIDAPASAALPMPTPEPPPTAKVIFTRAPSPTQTPLPLAGAGESGQVASQSAGIFGISFVAALGFVVMALATAQVVRRR